MLTLRSLFRSFLFYTAGISVGFLLSVLLYPLAFFPRCKRYDCCIFFQATHWWSRFLVWSAGITLHISGKENTPSYPSNASIIVINHTSAFDIPVVEMLLKAYPHIWISKHVYGRIPIMGTILKRMHLLLHRKALSNAVLVLRQAYKRAKDHDRHIVMFPEGTRAQGDTVGPFFQGFALLAKSLKRPVVPIAIHGLHKIYARGSLLVDSSACEVKISIGEPMYIASNETREKFVARVHEWFTNEMKTLSSH